MKPFRIAVWASAISWAIMLGYLHTWSTQWYLNKPTNQLEPLCVMWIIWLVIAAGVTISAHTLWRGGHKW